MELSDELILAILSGGQPEMHLGQYRACRAARGTALSTLVAACTSLATDTALATAVLRAVMHSRLGVHDSR